MTHPRSYQPRPSFLEPLPKLLDAQTSNRMLMFDFEVLGNQGSCDGDVPSRRLPRCSAQCLLALFQPYQIKILQKGFRRTYCANLSDDRQGCRSDLASTGSAPECDSVSALQDHCPSVSFPVTVDTVRAHRGGRQRYCSAPPLRLAPQQPPLAF